MRADSSLVPVSRVSVTDSVVGQLRAMILSSEYRAEDPLPFERELNTLLSVSRNVIREAIGILGQRGLVRVEQGRGTFVTAPSAPGTRDSLALLLSVRRVSLLELCNVRLLIEPELARRAASLATRTRTRRLTNLVAVLEATSDRPDDHVQADIDFHNEIATLADQPVLGAIVEAIQAPMRESMQLGVRVPGSIGESDKQHRSMYEAIVAGDPDTAAESSRRHIEYIRSYVVDEGT